MVLLSHSLPVRYLGVAQGWWNTDSVPRSLLISPSVRAACPHTIHAFSLSDLPQSACKLRSSLVTLSSPQFMFSNSGCVSTAECRQLCVSSPLHTGLVCVAVAACARLSVLPSVPVRIPLLPAIRFALPRAPDELLPSSAVCLFLLIFSRFPYRPHHWEPTARAYL